MELSQIRYFIAAAQFQNLSKAAGALNITQPALSKSISKLEDELGARLFDRYGKKIALNECGENFLKSALSSIQGLDEATSLVKNRVSNPALYLGLFHHSEKFMLCLKEFSETNPEVSFQLEHLEISSYNIDTNEFDMLLYPRNPLFSKYRGAKVYTDPYLLAVHRLNPLALNKAVRLSDIADQKVIFLKYGKTLFELPYHLCVSLDIRISYGIFTNSREVQRCLIANGGGIGFVPQGAAADYSSNPEIVLLPVSDEGLSQEIMIGFKREKHLSSVGRQFAAFVSSYFGIKTDKHKEFS